MPGTGPTAEPTRVCVRPGEARVRVELVTGALAPRLIERDSSSARVALAAAHMLLLDGDSVCIDIEVAPGCTLEIEDIGGTVAYPGTSSWQVRARVGAGGRLLWKGLPFVVTADARTQRSTHLTLGLGASALLRETLVLGRHGEVGGAIESAMSVSRMSVSGEHRPVLVERLEADAAHPGPGILGSHRVLDSLIAIGYRPPTRAGDLELESPGAIARFLGQATHASGLDAVWDDWHAALRAIGPIPAETALPTGAALPS